MPEIETSLGTLRRQRGLSAIQLAATVGVSRQTSYAMEAGTYVPNTAVALRLARALETTVEELFALPGGPPAPKLRSEQAALLRGSATVQEGQGVQLCRVEKRLMASAPSPVPWYFPATDAVIADKPTRRGKTLVQVFQDEDDFTNRILVAGCDPGVSVLSRHVQAAGIELVLAHRKRAIRSRDPQAAFGIASHSELDRDSEPVDISPGAGGPRRIRYAGRRSKSALSATPPWDSSPGRAKSPPIPAGG